MRPAWRLWQILVLLITRILRCSALAIDDPAFRAQVTNSTTVSFEVAVKIAGSILTWYPFSDIQARFGRWIVPLLILIGSFRFPPLRFRNKIFIAFHLMAEPLSSISDLLTRLDTHQAISTYIQRSRVPNDAKKATAIILAAYLDWAPYFWSSLRVQGRTIEFADFMEEKFDALETLLSDCRFPDLQQRRVVMCRCAAGKLSDNRVNGLVLTVIGTGNYLFNFITAFAHVWQGEFNNRTGHSIAFGLLWTWLLSAVFLSSAVGYFNDKRSVPRILEELQSYLDDIELEELEGTGQQIVQPLFEFYLLSDATVQQAEKELERDGMSYSINPSPLCPGKRRIILNVISFIPVAMATVAACWISYTNPTPGLSCRSVEQLCFLATWILSRALTALFRRLILDKGKQLWWVRAKDVLIGSALAICFVLTFAGWFNSVYCFSGYISLGGAAYIIVDPSEMIQHLAGTSWPVISFTFLGLQLIYVAIILGYFWKGVRLYAMSDQEHRRSSASMSTYVKG